jgi:hypothetical protein
VSRDVCVIAYCTFIELESDVQNVIYLSSLRIWKIIELPFSVFYEMIMNEDYMMMKRKTYDPMNSNGRISIEFCRHCGLECNT